MRNSLVFCVMGGLLAGCAFEVDAATGEPVLDPVIETSQALVCTPDAPTVTCASGVCPPGMPACGPGSAVYAHASVRVTPYAYNVWNDRYWIYEPAMPTPLSAPVLFYFHGWGETEPTKYDAMLRHLARKGYVAVFVGYGAPFAFGAWEGNARTAVSAAMTELNHWLRPHVRPQPGKVAFSGHSLGGVLAMRLAATPTLAPAIPAPALIVLADASTDSFFDVSQPVLAKIPSSTWLMIVQAETAPSDAAEFSSKAWLRTTGIPRQKKNFLRPHSDKRGTPAVTCDHFSPQAQPGNPLLPLDAADYWQYWRTTEGAMAAVFRPGTESYPAFCNVAGPVCDDVRKAGRWSNGVAVKPIENAAQLGY